MIRKQSKLDQIQPNFDEFDDLEVNDEDNQSNVPANFNPLMRYDLFSVQGSKSFESMSS